MKTKRKVAGKDREFDGSTISVRIPMAWKRHDQFGSIEWNDADKIRQVISEEIPAKVAADKAYQNARKNSDKQYARIEHDKALERVVTDLVGDHIELFKQFSDNPSFKKWLSEAIFARTYTSPE